MKTHNFTIVNLDTDSISFSKPDRSPFSDDEQSSLLADLNSNFPEKIEWAHDGIFEAAVILMAKNYILKTYACPKCEKAELTNCNHEDAKITKKGSSLKSSKIEPRLKDFMSEVIKCLLADRKEDILGVYHTYVREIHNLTSIDGWSGKKTITDAVLNPEHTTQQKILDSLQGAKAQMGDKIYVYYGEEPGKKMTKRTKTDRVTKIKTEYMVEVDCIVNPLHLRESWDATAPNHSVDILLKKIYNTLVIFKNVINIDEIPKYHLKSKKIKEELAKVLNAETKRTLEL